MEGIWRSPIIPEEKTEAKEVDECFNIALLDSGKAGTRAQEPSGSLQRFPIATMPCGKTARATW